MFWCAACGNPNIIVESTKSGYSMGKGLIGAVVLGPVGAVAGLDGKENTVFYCPKCGARLSKCMPEYEVSTILKMLNNPDASRAMLEEKRKLYPNMLWPKKWSGNESGDEYVGELASGTYVSRLSRMTEYDFLDAIESSMKKANRPVPKDDLEKAIIGDMSNLGVLDQPKYVSTYRDAVIKASKQGIVKQEKIDDIYFLIPARDWDEQRAFSLQFKANESNLPYREKGYFQGAQRLIQEEGPLSMIEIIEKLIEKYPEINSTNPYSAEACATMVTDYMIRVHKAEINEQGQYSALSPLQEEKATIEQYKAHIENTTIDEMTHRNIKSMQRTLDYLENHPQATVLEIANKTGVRRLSVEGSLHKLQEYGEVKCIGRGDGWIKIDIPEPELKERAYKRTLESERESRSRTNFLRKFTLDDVKRILREAADFIPTEHLCELLPLDFMWGNTPMYKALYLLQISGEVKREERDGVSYWCIIDEEVERKKRINKYWEEHNEEYKALTGEQDNLKNMADQLIKKVEDLQQRIKESQNRQRETTPEETDLIELRKMISVLKNQEASLGVFKGKEKKRLREQIGEKEKQEIQLKQTADQARQKLNSAEKEMQTALNEELKTVQADLTQSKKRLTEIEEEFTKDRK